MASIGDVANGLLAAPVPALLADTCALLDIVRAPRVSAAQHLRAVNAVRQAAADAPRRCTLIAASVAQKEFSDNLGREVALLQQHCDDLQRKADEFHTACGFAGVPHAPPAFSAVPLPAALEGLAQTVSNLATPLNSEPRLRELALQRAAERAG